MILSVQFNSIEEIDAFAARWTRGMDTEAPGAALPPAEPVPAEVLIQQTDDSSKTTAETVRRKLVEANRKAGRNVAPELIKAATGKETLDRIESAELSLVLDKAEQYLSAG